MSGDALPPFGKGRLAATYDRQAAEWANFEEHYERFRADVCREAGLAATRLMTENHDPGDEDRS